MKFIVVFALICSTAFAVPAAPKPQDPVRAFIAKQLQEWAPTLVAKDHKTTLSKLRRINEAPGLKEVVEQFEVSATDIYNDINNLAAAFVPFVQQYGLNDLLISELPGVAVKAASDTYESLVWCIQFMIGMFGYIGYPLLPEEIVGMFLVGGILSSTFVVPTYTIVELGEIFNAVNPDAYNQFFDILNQAGEDTLRHLNDFAVVLDEALRNLEDK